MEFIINYSDVSISANKVANAIGYKRSDITELMLDEINEVLNEVENRVDIFGGYRLFDEVSVSRDQIFINSIDFITEERIAAALRDSQSIGVIVCTIGEEVHKWIMDLFQTDPVKAYYADIAASILVENAINEIQSKLEHKLANRNIKVSNRYSPGYCGWNVKEQHKLFSLLPENFCGIRLNEEALMIPIKSVSGIIGIGSEIMKRGYACNDCEETDCHLNKTTKV